MLASETLVGDLRDFILDRLRHEHNPLPWNVRPEAEQRELISRTEFACRHLVHRACVIIASAGQPALRGTIVKVLVKDKFQAQIDVPAGDPLRHELVDQVGSTVLLVIADAEKFGGERAPAPVTKDQPGLLDDDEPPAEAA